MRINDLRFDQFRKYFEARLQGKRLTKAGAGWMALCPFHDDRSKSLSLNLEKGIWKCHAGCGDGGLIDFEKKFINTTDDQAAVSSIADLIGEPQLKMGGGQRYEALYPYTDEGGRLLFQVVRYPGKRFIQRMPCACQESKSRTCENPDCRHGWIYKEIALKTRTVLYHLREVVTANQVFICEGEKDVETVRRVLGLAAVDQYGKLMGESTPVAENVAVTTSPRGAGKWQDSFSPYLAGKKVVILPDNDESGEKHAAAVAHSVHRYAAGIKIVRLPGLEQKGDVTDFLKTKALADLVAEINKTPVWTPPEAQRELFVTVEDFIRDAPREVNWLVEGVIERGSNGMMVARPKAGKSFTILDLAIALAAGQSWMPGERQAGFFIPNPVKVALVSREDNPHTTQWRAVKLCDARQVNMQEIKDNLWINSRLQSDRLMIDDDDHLAGLIRALEKRKIEFLILDVFRRLHEAEENDNTEMQKIINRVISIQQKVGCQVALVHHTNKRQEEQTLTESSRGSSAIAGFAEWMIGLKIPNPEAPKHEWVREMEVELKGALPPDNFHFRITDQTPPKTGICLEQVYWEPPKKGRSKKADQLADSGQQRLPQESAEDIPF